MVDYNKIADIFNIKADPKDDSGEEYYDIKENSFKKVDFKDKVNNMKDTLNTLEIAKKEEKVEEKEKINTKKEQEKKESKSIENNDLSDIADPLFSDSDKKILKKTVEEEKVVDKIDSEFIASKTDNKLNNENHDNAITKETMNNKDKTQEVFVIADKETLQANQPDRQEELFPDTQVNIPKNDDTQSVPNDPVSTNTPYDNNNWEWDLSNDQPRYAEFYKQKKKIIEKITPNGTLKFEKIEQELRDAKVDVSTEIYNLIAIYEKMTRIQKWRERLQEIKINVNIQYFLWKRCIPMMQGILSKIECDKPIIKNESNFYYYIGDMEMYYARLESLKANTEAVDDNLSAAFECLSRQLSINYSIRDVPTHYGKKLENHVNVTQNAPQNIISSYQNKTDMIKEGFDELDTSKVINKRPVIKELKKVSF